MPSLEEARERVIRAAWTFGGPNRGPAGRTSLEITTKALAAFEDAIRSDARAEAEQRIAALGSGIRWSLETIEGLLAGASEGITTQQLDALRALAREEAESA